MATSTAPVTREDFTDTCLDRSGETIGGRYRIERLIGRGGMGVVYAAKHIHLGTSCAVKFIAATAPSGPVITRFLREGRSAARVDSEHISRVLDMGTLEDGRPFLVMELLQGTDLRQVLRNRGALPVREAVGYLMDACNAVIAAHAVGIVHRDIKPSNLIVCPRADGQARVKVLDFGVSKGDLLDRSGELSLTGSDALIGSPQYMSPEQAVGSTDVSTAVDVWGLGVTLYELLSGQPAFSGGSVSALAVKIATGPTPKVRSVRGGVPPRLDAIVSKCLEKKPELRFQSARELASALAPFLTLPNSAEHDTRATNHTTGRQKQRLGRLAILLSLTAILGVLLAAPPRNRHEAPPVEEPPDGISSHSLDPPSQAFSHVLPSALHRPESSESSPASRHEVVAPMKRSARSSVPKQVQAASVVEDSNRVNSASLPARPHVHPGLLDRR